MITYMLINDLLESHVHRKKYQSFQVGREKTIAERLH